MSSLGYHNIISFILEICHIFHDIRSIIYCSSLFLPTTVGLGFIIFLTLKFPSILDIPRHDFHSRPRFFSTIKSLGFTIPLIKRFADIVTGPEPVNYIALVIFSNLRDNALAVRFCISGLKNGTLTTKFYELLPVVSDLESTNYVIH